METPKENTMFYTPKNAMEIQDWIETHNGSEKAHMYVLAMMIQNFYVTQFDMTPKA